MPILKTNTGKEYECSFMGVSDNFFLYIQVLIDIETAFTVFRNPEETSVLTWIGKYGDIIREERDFTIFSGLTIIDASGFIRIQLNKNIAEVN